MRNTPKIPNFLVRPFLVVIVMACSVGCAQPDASTPTPAEPPVGLTSAVHDEVPPTSSWTAWGGPTGDFVVNTGGQLAESWPKSGPPVLWQRPLGSGYASVLYLDEILYTTYREDDDEVAVALSATTGETLWQQSRTPTLWEDMYPGFGLGPNSTPLIVDGTLVTLGIDGVVQSLALDTGELSWQLDLPADFGRLERVEEYGYSANPLAYAGGIIVLVGGEMAAVACLEPTDGSVRWQTPTGGVSYAQPVITELLSGDQYIYFEPEGVVALDPSSGEVLWRHPIEFNNGNHLTSAVRLDDAHVWISSQFDTGGGRLLRLSETADGEVAVEELWFNLKLQTSHWPLIVRGDVVYGSIGGNRTSKIAAVRWSDGEILWRKRGFHKAQSLWVDDKLLFLDEEGQLALARVSPEGFELLASVQMAEPDAWTVPTLVGTTLFVRDQEKLVAVELGI